jgi:RNA polymerase sigma-70 factor, ECF subfamily
MSAHDKQLAGRIARGERAAFEEFLDAYGPRVQRLVRRYVAQSADAVDLTQEIFLDLVRGMASFRGDSSLATWVYRVALNHCLRHNEKSRAAQQRCDAEGAEETPDTSADPARKVVRNELKGTVHCALEELSVAHRDVVVLHELHGLTYGECAQVLGVPVGTVKSRLSNAFRKLRVSLADYVLGEGAESAPEALGEAA